MIMFYVYQYPHEKIDCCGCIQVHSSKDVRVSILNHPLHNTKEHWDPILILEHYLIFISDVINRRFDIYI